MISSLSSLESNYFLQRTIMSKHEYFDRDSSTWNISDFLNVCDVEPFDNKLDVYLKSLENIFDQEQDTRKEKARALLDEYRMVNNSFLFL
jgi:hypothetical protein